MIDPQITFQGIDCPEIRAQVKDMLEDLTQLCPSDACVKATFRQSDDRISADVMVASESAYMQVVDSSTAIGDMLEHVKSQLMGQIVDWRNHRFAS